MTPYDTGDRLEPRPWLLESDDHYGLVDLDNDESATVFTIVGKKRDDGAPGYLLSIDPYSDDTPVEIDGDRVLVLDEDTLAGLNLLIRLARQGAKSLNQQDRIAAEYLVQQITETIQGEQARP